MQSCGVQLLISKVFASFCVLFLLTAGTIVTGAPKQSRQRNANSSQHYQVCPEVRCLEIPSSCQLVEFVAYEIPSQRSPGSTVLCRSCQYCLDLPERLQNKRTRRSLLKSLLSESHKKNRCPEIPDYCSIVRMTRTLITSQHGQWSLQCPVCFDRNMVNHGGPEQSPYLPL